MSAFCHRLLLITPWSLTWCEWPRTFASWKEYVVVAKKTQAMAWASQAFVFCSVFKVFCFPVYPTAQNVWVMQGFCQLEGVCGDCKGEAGSDAVGQPRLLCLKQAARLGPLTCTPLLFALFLRAFLLLVAYRVLAQNVGHLPAGRSLWCWPGRSRQQCSGPARPASPQASSVPGPPGAHMCTAANCCAKP